MKSIEARTGIDDCFLQATHCSFRGAKCLNEISAANAISAPAKSTTTENSTFHNLRIRLRAMQQAFVILPPICALQHLLFLAIFGLCPFMGIISSNLSLITRAYPAQNHLNSCSFVKMFTMERWQTNVHRGLKAPLPACEGAKLHCLDGGKCKRTLRTKSGNFKFPLEPSVSQLIILVCADTKFMHASNI